MNEKSRVLCTFSGKYGDIMWSMPTVRALAARYEHKLDFCCMPQYENLLPLIQMQPYINKAFVLPEWKFEGSPFGDQPWQAPTDGLGYEHVFHLTYRSHPQVECLADFTARQQCITLGDTWTPFLHLEEDRVEATVFSISENRVRYPDIVFGFNPDYHEYKSVFISRLTKSLQSLLGHEIVWKEVTTLPWIDAACAIKNAKVFVGCRSALMVVAHGFGKNVVTFEPNSARLSPIFGCRVGSERLFDLSTLPQCVDYVKGFLQ